MHPDPSPHDSNPLETVSERDIAIIGMAGRFPKSRDLAALWRNLADGVEAITFFSDEELLAAGVPRADLRRPDYVKAASLLEEIERFDADFFGYTPRDAELLDPQQRLFLEYAWSALEDAGYTPQSFDGLIGIYAGVAWNTYLLSNLMSHRELFDGAGAFQIFISNDKDFLPTRASYKLDLKGPSVLVQTSCSTSLVATHLACLALQSYECDMALAGGVTVKVPQVAGYTYQEGGLASPDGHCRTFDAKAAGTIFGSGIGLVVLKRLEEALEDGDTIRAVIKGSAINNDGSVKVSYTAPSVEGQAEVVAAAQEMAEVDPRTIRYVECHGTATSLGDPIEVRALSKVFKEATGEERGMCALGSIKSNFGHLDAAAGVAGLLKTVLALQHRQIPPSLGFEEPNPALELERGPFYVAAELEEWTAKPDVPRRAGVSSFGVGGTNAHAVLEEAPPTPPMAGSRPWQVLTLSARSKNALERAAQALGARLADPATAASPTELGLADAAYTLRVGRVDFQHRRAVVCRDRAEAVALLSGEAPRPGGAMVISGQVEERGGSGREGGSRPVAFLFSGQGSQYLGMARELAEEEVFRGAFERCAQILEPELEEDLSALLWPPEGASEEEVAAAAEKLGRTQYTQPALFAIEYALAEQWRGWGVEPHGMLGHSIGEYVAACLGGTLSLEDALRLVAMRGRLMDDLPRGAMLAVPLGEADLASRLAGHPGLSIAALNEPERSVVSGPSEAVEAFAVALESEGLEGRPLHTSHAFHSAMMEPVLEPFLAAVREIDLKAPERPWISNLSGTWITAEESTDPAYWARHLRGAVRFADGVATLLEDPNAVLLEVGPGRTLATLAGRHPSRRSEQAVVSSLPHPRDLGDALAHLLGAYGRLWLAGVELDAEAFFDAEARRRVPLPTYPFEGRRFWIESGASSSSSTSTSTSTSESDRRGAVAAPRDLRQQADPADWLYLPAWTPTLPRSGALPGDADPGAAKDAGVHEEANGQAACLVLASAEWSDLLRGALEERGWRVATVNPGEAETSEGLRRFGEGSYALDPTAGEAWGALGDALAADGLVPSAVLHAWSLGDPSDNGSTTVGRFGTERSGTERPGAERLGAERPGDGIDPLTFAATTFATTQAHGTDSLQALLATLARAGCPNAVEWVVVADGVAALADEPVLPAKMTLLGYCRVLPQEHGGSAKLVDARPKPGEGQALAACLAAELSGPQDADTASGTSERIVLRGARRWVESSAPARLVDAQEASASEGLPGLRTGGHYLVTGGLRGNGYAFARVLARRLGARLLLLEESLPGDTEARLGRLAEEGGMAQARAVDLNDPGALAATVAEAEAHFGPLLGVLHAASTQGEETFRPLAEIDAEHVLRHTRLKIGCAAALDAALGDRQLELCIALSSLATVLGGLAYGAYTAANAALEAWACSGERRLPWRVLSWDVWEFDSEAEQIVELRADLAELAMTPLQGEEAFARALACAAPHVLVSTGDLAARRAHLRERSAVSASTRGPRHPRPQLATPFVAPRGALEERVVAVWQEFFGFEEIGIDDNFFELGGDSFIAVRVAARLREALEVELPVAQLYERLTVRSLAELLSDAEGAASERAAHLEERRASMGRRRDLLQRRRARRRPR